MTKQQTLEQINQLADIIPMVYNNDTYTTIIDALDSVHAAEFVALVAEYEAM